MSWFIAVSMAMAGPGAWGCAASPLTCSESSRSCWMTSVTPSPPSEPPGACPAASASYGGRRKVTRSRVTKNHRRRAQILQTHKTRPLTPCTNPNPSCKEPQHTNIYFKKRKRMNAKEVSRQTRSVQAGGVFLPYRRAGGHLHHRYMHLANVCVQAAQFLERAAAVHALEEWQAFVLQKDRKLLDQEKNMFGWNRRLFRKAENHRGPSTHP